MRMQLEQQMNKMCDLLADARDPTVRERRRVTAAARTARCVHVGHIQLVLVLVQATNSIRDVTDRKMLSACFKELTKKKHED